MLLYPLMDTRDSSEFVMQALKMEDKVLLEVGAMWRRYCSSTFM